MSSSCHLALLDEHIVGERLQYFPLFLLAELFGLGVVAKISLKVVVEGADDAGRVAAHHHIVGHRLGDDAAGSYQHIVTHGDAGHQLGIGTYIHVIAHTDLPEAVERRVYAS